MEHVVRVMEKHLLLRYVLFDNKVMQRLYSNLVCEIVCKYGDSEIQVLL